MPQFSVLVPTRGRPDTLKFTIETILAQDSADFEVVVANNNGDPETSAIVQRLGDPRLREVRSDRSLSMSANWEMGINECQGEYVTVIGDDDGLMPEALSYAALIVQQTGTKLITFPMHDYFWPNAFGENNRNRLCVRHSKADSIIQMASGPILNQLYGFQIDYASIPMIYNSFVHRSIVETAQSEIGSYFAYTVPDVYSGIVNLHYTDTYIRSTRALGMRGTSRHSNGGAFLNTRSEEAKKMVQKFYEESGIGSDTGLHSSIFPTESIHIITAGVFMAARDILFPEHPQLKVDFLRPILLMLDHLRMQPDLYDLRVSEIHRLAGMHGIDTDSIAIPERPPQIRIVPMQGAIYNQNGEYDCLIVNGDTIGLKTIADAVRLASATTSAPWYLGPRPAG